MEKTERFVFWFVATLIVLVVGFGSMQVFATEQPKHRNPSVSQSSASNSTAEGGQASSIAKGGTGGSVGSVTSGGGSATVGDTGEVNVNVRGDDAPRQAPAIALVTPQSTAPLLKCIGLGGSDERGSVVAGWCWLQRDLYSFYRAENHERMKRYEAAAKALCSKKLFRNDFKDKDDCLATVHQSLINQEVDENTRSGVALELGKPSNESSNY